MKTYKLLLMTPDGEGYVTEGENLTLDEATNLSCDMGSRWLFYPLHFIIKDNSNSSSIDNQRIIEAGDTLQWSKGLAVKSIRKFLSTTPYPIL